MNTNNIVLSEHHLASLKASGISDEVISARGYYTEEDPAALRSLGFDLHQKRLVPALVIPIRNVTGEVVVHRIRPDAPRPKEGKPGKFNKYEMPTGKDNVIDVPAPVIEHLADTNRTLWIVEGEKKADALVSRGEVAVALLGVWAWKRHGLPLPEFDRIPMIGREVRIAFDSDAKDNAQVRRALYGLARYVGGRIGDA